MSSEPEAEKILVVANETVAGRPLVDAVKRRMDAGPIKVRLICPQNQPKHGYVINDEHGRAAAENRLRMTLALLQEIGVEAEGAVMDPDPYSAVMDAIGVEDFDEIIISTHPETRSGWLRQGLVDRVARATRRPVEHVVVELELDDDAAKRMLVVANQTVGDSSLLDFLKRRSDEQPRRFIVVCPQSGGLEGGAAEAAAQRLARTLRELEDAGLQAVGQVAHSDPYTAIQNALQFYGVDEIVISTFPETRSGWLRSDLVGRVQRATGKPVEHVVAVQTPAPAEGVEA